MTYVLVQEILTHNNTYQILYVKREDRKRVSYTHFSSGDHQKIIKEMSFHDAVVVEFQQRWIISEQTER